ncbi:hypothetical protein CRENBAI_005169, partial [Crenichthys baileyi]
YLCLQSMVHSSNSVHCLQEFKVLGRTHSGNISVISSPLLWLFPCTHCRNTFLLHQQHSNAYPPSDTPPPSPSPSGNKFRIITNLHHSPQSANLSPCGPSSWNSSISTNTLSFSSSSIHKSLISLIK